MRKLLNSELGRLGVEEYRRVGKRPVVVVLDNVRSAHNVGAVFRCGDAFGIERVVLCGICAVPPNNQLHKTALGAEFAVEWEYFKTALEAVERLKRDGYRVLAVEQAAGAIPLNEARVEEWLPLALVFGNEVNGVGQEVVDACVGCVDIPQVGTKHSLNVSVAVGVVLWEVCRQLVGQRRHRV